MRSNNQIINKIKSYLLTLRSKNLMSLILISIVVFLLAYSLIKQRDQLATIHWSLNLIYLSLTFFSYSFGLFAVFTAWLRIMKKMGSKEKIKDHLLVISKSMVARRIPLPIWYIGSRFYFYPNASESIREISVATLLEIVLTGSAGLFIGLLFTAFYYKSFLLWIIWGCYLGILLIAFKHEKANIRLINMFLKLLHKDSINISIPLTDLGVWFALYGLGWIFAGFSFYFGIKSVIEINISLLFGLTISAISGLIGFFSMILPAGLGLKEISTGLLLAQSLPFGAGFLLGVVNRIYTTLIEIIWSLIISFLFKDNP